MLFSTQQEDVINWEPHQELSSVSLRLILDKVDAGVQNSLGSSPIPDKVEFRFQNSLDHLREMLFYNFAFGFVF